MPLYVVALCLLSPLAPLHPGDPTPLSLGRFAPTTPASVGSPLIQDDYRSSRGAIARRARWWR